MEIEERVKERAMGDCWPVQMGGVDECVGCELFNTPECGGGVTLVSIILGWCPGAPLAAYSALTELYRLEERPSFHEIRRMVKEGDERVMWASALDYPINHYLRWVKRQKIVKEDRERHPEAPLLNKLYPYKEVSETGKLLLRGGWHRPQVCGCEPITPGGGAYRDEAYMILDWGSDPRVVIYLHQNAIMVLLPYLLMIDSCGWRTPTTLNRLNKWLPKGYRIYQRRWRWYLKTPTGETKFYDGMLIDITKGEFNEVLAKLGRTGAQA